VRQTEFEGLTVQHVSHPVEVPALIALLIHAENGIDRSSASVFAFPGPWCPCSCPRDGAPDESLSVEGHHKQSSLQC